MRILCTGVEKIIDPDTGEPAPFSITAKQYGDLLCELFSLWYEYGPEKLNIRDLLSFLRQYRVSS
jgi:sulfatase maturation enzyme AslB (radical SAM superfamily)